MLEKGGEEDEQVVLGQCLPHANPTTKTKWNKLLLLHKTPVPVKHLKKSLWPAKKSVYGYDVKKKIQNVNDVGAI